MRRPPPRPPLFPYTTLFRSQQRLWFLSRFEGASAAYHIAAGLRLIGRLEREALVCALDRIVTRHEALRTVFYQRSEEHTSELQSRRDLVCRLLLEKKN